jgi:hypothetical protein
MWDEMRLVLTLEKWMAGSMEIYSVSQMVAMKAFERVETMVSKMDVSVVETKVVVMVNETVGN